MAPETDNDLASDSRFEWALAAVKDVVARGEDIRTVFDIGSGNELLARDIRSMGLQYFSFDAAPSTETVRYWNIEDPFPYSGSADVVLFLEIVEHLNNPWLGVSNVSKVLRPGGYLVLSTPNPAWSGSRLSLVGRGVLAMFTEEDLRLNHHVFTPWRHVLERLLLDNGIGEIALRGAWEDDEYFCQAILGDQDAAPIDFQGDKTLLERVDRQARGAAYGIVGRKNIE